jgi:hypothetical protein
MPSIKTNKLCMHAHVCDRSVAAAIFANGTYFVDKPHIEILKAINIEATLHYFTCIN